MQFKKKKLNSNREVVVKLERFNQHWKRNISRTFLVCPNCYKIFNGRNYLKFHLKRQEKCEKININKNEKLQPHVITQEKDVIYFCGKEQCKFLTNDEQEFYQHVDEKLCVATINCTRKNCNFTTKHEKKIIAHEKQHLKDLDDLIEMLTDDKIN